MSFIIVTQIIWCDHSMRLLAERHGLLGDVAAELGDSKDRAAVLLALQRSL